MKRIAIIGAGLAGLTLARFLQKKAKVTLIEKARGVSGRMSTRYAGAYEFDHGAQYFTIRSKAFRQLFDEPDLSSSIALWTVDPARIKNRQELENFVVLDEDKPFQTNNAVSKRYVGTPRVNTLCKAMAKGLDIRLGERVARLDRTGVQEWRIKLIGDQMLGPFDWVISTAPAPQTRLLLPEDFADRPRLNKVQMQGCYSLMLGFKSPLELAFSAARFTGSPIGWVAVNSKKPGRAKNACSLLVQSSNEWAETHIDAPSDWVEETLLEALEQALQKTLLSTVDYRALHRWRYAATSAPAGVDYLYDAQLHLAACGDWCLGARVEHAFTSALKLSEKLRQEL